MAVRTSLHTPLHITMNRDFSGSSWACVPQGRAPTWGRYRLSSELRRQHPPMRSGLREWGVLYSVSLDSRQRDENPRPESGSRPQAHAGWAGRGLSRAPGVARSLRVHPKTLTWWAL